MKKLIILSAILSLSYSYQAQTTFTSTQTGDWNVGTTWGGVCSSGCTAGVDFPSTLDIAVVAQGTFVTITENAECNFLTVYGDASFSSGLVLNSGDSLTVHSDMLCETTEASADIPVTIDGDLVVGGTFSYDLKHSDCTGAFTISSTGSLDLNGATNRFRCITSGLNHALTINVDGPMDCASLLLLSVQRGGANITFAVNNTVTTAGLTLQSTQSTSSIMLDLNNIFDCNGNLTMTRASGGSAANTTLDMKTSGAEFMLSGSYSYIASTGGFVDAHVSNSSRFVYDGSSTQTIANHANVEYHDLVIANTTGAALGAALGASNILGDIIIETGGIFAAGAYNVTHDGNWIENGTGSFTQSTGTVTFNGSSLQTISGTVNFPNDVIITNTNTNGVVLDASSSVTFETLTINTNGVFKSNGADFSVTGNMSNAGTFMASNDDIVSFSGSSAQTISGTNPWFFQDVTITNPVGVNITPGTNIVMEDITINTGGILGVSTGTLYVNGNWTNNHGNAGFTASTGGTIIFSGNTAQSIGGSDSTTFRNLTISNTFATAPQVSLSSKTQILELLDVTDGQLDANGNLILVSNASGTAALADLSNGTPESPAIIDNVTAQRYVNEGNPYWYMIASPMTDTELEDWDDNTYTTGIANSDDPAESFVSVASWDESGCINPTPSDMTTQSHNNGADQSGWFIYGNSGITFDVTGTLRTGSVSMSGLSLGSGCTEGDGWHLLGNPYAAHVLWDNVSLTNIAGAGGGSAYVLQNDGSGNYVEYDHSSANHIASGEAFWVQVGAATGTVAFAENDKSGSALDDDYNSVRLYTHDKPLFKIRMDIPATGRTDETRFQLREGASDGYEWFNETTKLANINNEINIASQIGSLNILHNSIDYDADSLTFPIRLYRGQGSQNTTDSFNLTFKDVKLFTECNKCLILEDTTQNTLTKIDSSNQVHQVVMPDDGDPRLFLHFYSPLSITAQDPTCAINNDGYIAVKGKGAGPFNYIWLNETLDTVRVINNITTSDTLSNVSEGEYTVIVTNNGACGTVRAVMTMQAPLSVNNTSVSQTPASCFGGNDGTATIHVDSITPGMTFLWSNGYNDTTATGLVAGSYTVTISDGACSITQTVTVADGASQIQQVYTLPTNCYGDSTGSANIQAIFNPNGYVYTWSTGDSTANISGLSAGTYQYTVTSNSNSCIEVGSISINQPAEISALATTISESCAGEESGIVSLAVSGGTGSYYILWDNGSEGALVDSLGARDYSVTISDSLGCQNTVDVSISEYLPLTSGFTLSDDTVNTGEIINFINTSSNANTYMWYFGDGDSSMAADPNHAYVSGGLYAVSLSASMNGYCEEVYTDSVYINNVAIYTPDLINSVGIKISHNQERVLIETNFRESNKLTISLYNSLGQIIEEPLQKDVRTGSLEIALPKASGGYFVHILKGDKIIFYKVIK